VHIFRYANPLPALRNPQWLLTEGSSSFAASASAWGLGPGARMERFDWGGQPVLRVDWGRDDCVSVGAANLAQAEKCPNLMRRI
jgi:hypothetical protein